MTTQAPTGFPTVYWPAWDADATFLPGQEFPAEAGGQFYAALVFAFWGAKVVLADIAGRGLCIPSGRLEMGETPLEAAVREVREETGGHLPDLRLLGSYRMVHRAGTEPGLVRWSPVYVAPMDIFDVLPSGTESRGVFLCDLADVPGIYFSWDPLIAAVFAHADAHRP